MAYAVSRAISAIVAQSIGLDDSVGTMCELRDSHTHAFIGLASAAGCSLVHVCGLAAIGVLDANRTRRPKTQCQTPEPEA